MKNQCHGKLRLLIPLVILTVVALLALAVFGLWNSVVTDVFGMKTISYWQALGLLVLARILFGGFPKPGGRPFGPPWRRHVMMKRWQSLPPEQREQMRQEMRRRFGDWPMPPFCGGESDETETPGGPAKA